MYLYEKMEVRREDKAVKPAPEYIKANVSFDLRPYQIEAFENFVTHFESANRPKPTQVLFHMATGSGKTLIMAGLIVYLYAQGYRNFLFFVNLTNILDKTRDNFLDPTSKKYLFAKELTIGGKRVRVNVVDNFQRADAEAINICFSTTQGLHMAMNFVKENGMTDADFRERKTVLISDEAHHLNVSTKLSAAEETSRLNWEGTVEKIFGMNSENVLLEFTATCDLANPSIREKYEDKIIFDYPLKNFYTDRYSKEIITFRTAAQADRVLTALVMSQYRLKLFEDNRRRVKPVVLFKAAKIDDSKAFQKNFAERMKNLRGSELQALSERSGDEMLKRAFDYFSGKGITFDMLAAELREGFSERHCISANNDIDATDNQRLLNSLESENNPYRAVFEVKKLDEGWDVLNLFDIVRLYETRSSKKATIAEAQLIGRGARYCPFKLEGKPEYRRKFDDDLTNDLRVCETLYYHCQNDRRYINELHEALREIGLPVETGVERTYKLTEPFKSDELYRTGMIFLNRQKVVESKFLDVLPEKLYRFERMVGGGRDKVMTAEVESVGREVKQYTRRRTFAEMAERNYATVHKALRQYPIFAFDRLSGRFGVKSTREFITSEKFLGGVAIDIVSDEREPSLATLYAAAFDVLGKTAAALEKEVVTYKGTTDFNATPIQAVFRDKTVRYPDKKDDGIGEPQSDLNLAEADWFAFNDNFGTSEEKAFVKYFSGRVDDLKKIYSKVYLVRNERAAKIYSFEDGAGFEPDFVLFLQKGDGVEQYQIFIEPKGTHLLEHDAWKEKFLRELKDKAKVFVDDDRYKIWGLPFYNRDKLVDFDKAFGALLKA